MVDFAKLSKKRDDNWVVMTVLRDRDRTIVVDYVPKVECASDFDRDAAITEYLDGRHGGCGWVSYNLKN